MSQESAIATNPSLAVRIGRWWFQRRSLSPVPLFLLLIVAPAEFQWSWDRPLLPIIVLTLIIAAEALRIYSVGFAGSVTRTRGDKVPSLVVAGPYRYVRNPLYIANIILYTCCGLIFGSVSITIIIFVYSVVQYTLIVAYEEQLLENTFGESYLKYKSEVPRWLPGVPNISAESEHEFDLGKALRSERSTFMCLGAVCLLWLIKRVWWSQ